MCVGLVALPVLRCLGTGLVAYRAGWVLEWLCSVLVVYWGGCVQHLLGTRQAGYEGGWVLGWLFTGLAGYESGCVQCWLCTVLVVCWGGWVQGLLGTGLAVYWAGCASVVDVRTCFHMSILVGFDCIGCVASVELFARLVVFAVWKKLLNQPVRCLLCWIGTPSWCGMMVL
jgi:hypothetical protein